MAVAASRDCLTGMDKLQLDGVFLSSTTLPFADRQNAGIVSTALNLRNDILTSDFTSSQKAGTTALVRALETLKGGEKKNILVTASDRRETKTAYFYEMWFGDAAASLVVGDSGVIAEFKGSHSVSYDFVPHYRGLYLDMIHSHIFIEGCPEVSTERGAGLQVFLFGLYHAAEYSSQCHRVLRNVIIEDKVQGVHLHPGCEAG